MAKPNDFWIKPGTRTGHSRRGGLTKRRDEQWNIDGQQYTLVQIAERLGITPDGAGLALRKLRKLPGPITWERILNRPKVGRPCSTNSSSSTNDGS